MTLLTDFRVAQLGPGRAAAVCGRLFADAGAAVTAVDPAVSNPLEQYLNAGKTTVAKANAEDAVATANVIVCEGAPGGLRNDGWDEDRLRHLNKDAAIVLVSNYGQTGPHADDPATDLTLFYASGMARLQTGQVTDLTEPPMRPVGEQSAFLGGVAAACAGMQAALLPRGGATVDISIQEALATLAISELARAGLTGRSWSRKRVKDGNGATVTILPAKDGYTAISPREDHQWAAWLAAMGSPEWGDDPRFAAKPDRIENWDALHALMSDWSRRHDKQWIADTAQAAHVPSFPLRDPAEQLDSPQLAHREFYKTLDIDGRTVKTPSAPFTLTYSDDPDTQSPRPIPPGPLPLSGIRILDFSWVIAGPTATRHLAAMGAEVIKVEAPGRGDPGRTSELHTVLGQAKQGIVLNLKNPDAVGIATALAARSDVLIENFATGVMDRLGLGAETLHAANPNLIYLSASGLGRTGPEAGAVAYGTLLQCYAGFAGLNRHPDNPPRIGFAWLDPMCGLMLPFVVAAALQRRRTAGHGVRIDFSMIEAMLWTMAQPLLATQLDAPPRPAGNFSPHDAPHNAYRCAGEDEWLAVAVTRETEWQELCAAVPPLAAMADHGLWQRLASRDAIDAKIAEWARPLSAQKAAATLCEAGVPAAALATSRDLIDDPHLNDRGFWDRQETGVLPGLPWKTSFGRKTGAAPGLGADTDTVLREVLGLSDDRIAALRRAGALG